jgi:tRNA pseudouridine38-40 synthase
VRLRLDIAYDGTEFSGWALQPGRRTVQQAVEAALCQVLRLESVSTVVAGRTDAGVHARGQVCHVDVPAGVLERDGADLAGPALDSLLRRMAGVLPVDVRVRAIAVAPPGFDARFSALSRRYAYRICDDRALIDPLRRREVLAWPRRLDVEAMNAAAALLLGEHDFAAFCRRREGATTVRTLLELEWTRDRLVVARVVADAFCHNMVRSLVGSLIAVGEGKRPVGWPAHVLAGRTRQPEVWVSRPHALTLEEVTYPSDNELAAQDGSARRVRTLS